MSVSIFLLWIFQFMQLLFLLYLAKLIREFLNRFRLSSKQVVMNTLKPGEKAPMFREKDQHGNTVILSEHHGPTLLVFASDSCSTCKRVLPYLGEAFRVVVNLRILVITTSSQGKDLPLPSGVQLIRSDEVWNNYLVSVVPTAFLINENITVLASHTLADKSDLIHILKENLNQAS